MASRSSLATSSLGDDPLSVDDVEGFGAVVILAVANGGLEAALTAHAEGIARCWMAFPATVQRLVEDWMAADPATRPLLPQTVAAAAAARAAGPTSAAMPPPSAPRAETDAVPPTTDDANGEDVRPPPDGDVAAMATRRGPDAPVPGVDEADGRPVTVYRNEPWRNWASTQQSVPSLTFVPRTVAGVVAIVRHAAAAGLRVRASGTRHSWSDIFGGDSAIMVGFVPPAFAEGTVTLPPNPADTELEEVRFVREETDAAGKRVGLVHVGAAATADHFRRWAASHREWALPALPILVEITFGGSLSAICHGAGFAHQTVSDLVASMDFVNVRGDVQTVSDPALLAAAAGCFGLLGVVVGYTLRAVPMGFANYFPQRVPTPLAVPPVARSDVPANRDFSVEAYTDEQLDDAVAIFERDARKFYAEWFWFPYQSECWVNTWDLDGSDPGENIRPTRADVARQNLEAALGVVYERTFLRKLPGRVQARQLARAAMALLPAGEAMPTLLSEALHFRRGIHRLPVRDLEVAIPLPPRPDRRGEPDLRVARAAWWAAIDEVYARLPDAPMRTTLEMRVVGDSDMLLSTQRGNTAGTAHIEVLTNSITPEAEWTAFTQALVDRWALLTDAAGQPLNVRPHWAKEWPALLRGRPIVKELRETAYRDALPQFRSAAAQVASQGGYSWDEALSMFGHATLEELLA